MFGVPTLKRNPTKLNLIGSRQVTERAKRQVQLLLSINLHNIHYKITSVLCRNVETPSYLVIFRPRGARDTFSKYRSDLFSIKFL